MFEGVIPALITPFREDASQSLDIEGFRSCIEHVITGGDVVGNHTVQFHQNYETIELTHRAYDRAVFIHGAVHAAAWVSGKTPGFYPMKDVLGL